MRPRILLTIYRKEIREALRDRRTLFMMIGLPIFLYPLLMIGLSRLQEGQAAAQTARVSGIAVWGQLPEDISKRIEDPGRVVLLPWAGAPDEVVRAFANRRYTPPPAPPMQLEAGDEAPPPGPPSIFETPWARAARLVILERKADAVAIVWPGFSERLEKGETGIVTILYDSVRSESLKARNRLNDALRLYRAELARMRLKAKGLPRGYLTAIELQSENVASEQRRSGLVAGMLLPYMLIMFSAISGFYAAIDMTAGEKERGTMQTLLCAPVEALEIIGGKFLAVWTIAISATIINLLSLAMTFSRLKLLPGMTMKIEPSSYFIAFIMLLPISMMINALFLAVGAYAKDFKDGQNFLTPMLMGLLVPLSATMMPGIELNGYLAFIPVVNTALLVKAVFLGEWHADMFFLVVLSSACYAMMSLVFAARVFERNNILLGGKENLISVLDFSRRPGSKPAPSTSLFAFAVALVAVFYGSLSLTRFGLPITLGVTQIGFFLLPAVGLAFLKGYNLRETLSLRLPSASAIIASILVGISAWTIAGGLFVRLLPPPESLVKAIEKILLLDDKAAPFWQIWLLVALTPAICEETLFRGLIMSGFRRLGAWPAIVITGLLFGVAHASVYRLLPTMFLGALFGFAVWKTRSIAAGMICHMLNNGLMLILARSKPLVEYLGLSGAKYLPWPTILAGCAVMIAGIWLLYREGKYLAAADGRVRS